MNRILLVERIHQAGEEMLAKKAGLVYLQPPHPWNPLLQMENVIVTPHFCAMTEESLYNMATMVAQGVIDVLEGRRPRYQVNP